MQIPKIRSIDVLKALRKATQDWPPSTPFRLNASDRDDLLRLKRSEIGRCLNVADPIAAKIVDGLSHDSLSGLGEALDVHLDVDPTAKNLIPGAGIARSAGALADEAESYEDMLDFFRNLRHPNGN